MNFTAGTGSTAMTKVQPFPVCLNALSGTTTLITRDPVAEKRAKVETLREKVEVEEEKTKHEKSVYNKAKFSEEESVLRENYRTKIDLLHHR
ncbi:hypothetical protein VNO80_21568 [Phaseolus coccineus]|uniref:Uncharacterized protein n=1 Tax=Phaseolus coccineus TaxID=3886 RepID=A0AAN9QT77_PHACN